MATCIRRVARLLWSVHLSFQEGFDKVVSSLMGVPVSLHAHISGSLHAFWCKTSSLSAGGIPEDVLQWVKYSRKKAAYWKAQCLPCGKTLKSCEFPLVKHVGDQCKAERFLVSHLRFKASFAEHAGDAESAVPSRSDARVGSADARLLARHGGRFPKCRQRIHPASVQLTCLCGKPAKNLGLPAAASLASSEERPFWGRVSPPAEIELQRVSYNVLMRQLKVLLSDRSEFQKASRWAFFHWVVANRETGETGTFNF